MPLGKRNRSNALNALMAVLDGSDEAQWRPVIIPKWLPVHLINQQRLRMKRAFHVDGDIVLIVRSRHCDIRSSCGLRRVALNKMTERHTAPLDDATPTLNAFEFTDEFLFW